MDPVDGGDAVGRVDGARFPREHALVLVRPDVIMGRLGMHSEGTYVPSNSFLTQRGMMNAFSWIWES